MTIEELEIELKKLYEAYHARDYNKSRGILTGLQKKLGKDSYTMRFLYLLNRLRWEFMS